EEIGVVLVLEQVLEGADRRDLAVGDLDPRPGHNDGPLRRIATIGRNEATEEPPRVRHPRTWIAARRVQQAGPQPPRAPFTRLKDPEFVPVVRNDGERERAPVRSPAMVRRPNGGARAA